MRCNGCGQVFTAEAPAQAGEHKYADSAAAMIAQLRYGSGVPFQRLERLEANLGIPLPAATQWEVVEEKAELLRPAFEELIGQAAQGELAHNDDTSMRISETGAGAGAGGQSRAHRSLHQRDCIAGGRVAHGPILQRVEACWGELGGSTEAACARSSAADPNVRCAVAECP
jgi:hypothetical protein